MKQLLFLIFGIVLIIPAVVFGDTGDIPTVWPGCRPNEEKISCSSGYDMGCEEYKNNSSYYIGRAEKHGVTIDYEFCKGSAPTQNNNKKVLMTIAGLIGVASIGGILSYKMKRRS